MRSVIWKARNGLTNDEIRALVASHDCCCSSSRVLRFGFKNEGVSLCSTPLSKFCQDPG